MKYKYELKITVERPDYSEEVIYENSTKNEETVDIILRHGREKVKQDKLDQIDNHDCQLSMEDGCNNCEKLFSF